MRPSLISTVASILTTIFLLGCGNELYVDFAADKYEYKVGEIITLTNKSRNASSYEWTFPDGHESNAVDTFYYIDPFSIAAAQGSVTISLKAYDDLQGYDEEVSQTFTILPADPVVNGSIVFWQDTGSGWGLTSVYLYDFVTGFAIDSADIEIETPEIPYCYDDGVATFAGLPEGQYLMDAWDGTNYVFDTVYVWAGYCLEYEVY